MEGDDWDDDIEDHDEDCSCFRCIIEDFNHSDNCLDGLRDD